MRRDTIIAFGLFALAFWHFLSFVEDPGRDRIGYHRDEARWIHRSYFIEELFHPNSPTWSGDSILTLGQPPLGSYLMGIGLWIQGRELGPNGFYNFSHNAAWNEARGNVPAWEDLYAGRRTNAFVGALTVALVYLIVRRLSSRVGGIIGALILIPHPLNDYLTTFAGSDALLIFLVAAAALVAILLAERPTWPRGILLGVLIGLGGATKLTPIALAFPLAAVGVAILAFGLPGRLAAATTPLLPGERRIPQWRRLLATVDGPERAIGWMLVTVPIVAFATFVAIYPYLWSDPIANSQKLFDYRSAEMANQSELYEQTQVAGPIEAIERVRAQLGGRTSTSRWLSEQLALRFDRAPYWPDLDLKFGVLGMLLMAGWAMMYGLRSPHALAWVVIAGEGALIILFMQVDFNRYHLPILLMLAVGCGFVVGQGWNAIAAMGRLYEYWRTRGRRAAVASSIQPAGAIPHAAAGTSSISATSAIHSRPATTSQAPIFAALLGIALVLGRAILRLRDLTRSNSRA